MRRGVSILRVEDPVLWPALERHLEGYLHPHDAVSRILEPMPPDEVWEKMALVGLKPLVRWARQPSPEASLPPPSPDLSVLRQDVLDVLHRAQRYAHDHEILGLTCWDPEHDAGAVRALVTHGCLLAMPDDRPHLQGRYRVNELLPAPPSRAWDFEEAVMPRTDDLEPPRTGPVTVLDNVASLAAAIGRVGARKTRKGAISRPCGKRLGKQLGDTALQQHGEIRECPEWDQALRALELLRGLTTDPLSQTLHLDLGLEQTLRGTHPEVIDRLMRQVLDRDLHAWIPPIFAAISEAGEQAIDEVVFLDLVREQARDLVFHPWSRDGVAVYPHVEGSRQLLFNDDGWELIETDLFHATLHRLAVFGIVQRAPGVFAATSEGRIWARATEHAPPPVWVSSDLQLTVPPHSLTPWERYHLESFTRCSSRDIVDRFVLEREALVSWLSTHELDEAIGILQRRCPAIPSSVAQTLESWERAARVLTVTHGVVLDDQG